MKRFLFYAVHRYTGQRIPYDPVVCGCASHPVQEYKVEIREIDERAYEDLLARSEQVATFDTISEAVEYAKANFASDTTGGYPSKQEFEARATTSKAPEPPSGHLNVGPFVPKE